MSRNVVLESENGEQILPITTAENVFVSPGVTLLQVLENMSGGSLSLGVSYTSLDNKSRIANYTLIEEG
jgi:hypothetical protein